MTRLPFVSDPATCSANSRQHDARRNSASPSFHSLLARSKLRGVLAMVKLATATRVCGVYLNSGAAVRLPTIVITTSFATANPLDTVEHVMRAPGDPRQRVCPIYCLAAVVEAAHDKGAQ